MIRKVGPGDRDAYLKMAGEFYASDAVAHTLPARHFENTFAELMRSDEYAEAYLFETGGEAVGYALLAKTFSQEAGGLVVWVEELFVRPAFRGQGLARAFFALLGRRLPHGTARLRLEAEPGNRRAIGLYEKLGFARMPYVPLFLDLPQSGKG